MPRQCVTTSGLRSSQLTMGQGSFSKIALITTLVLLFTLVGFVREIKSEGKVEEPENEKGPFNCQKIMLRAAKVIMKVLSRCGREVKANTTNNKEYGDHIGCVMKCAMRDANMTTPDLRVTPESLLVMMKKFVHSELLINEVNNLLTRRCNDFALKLDPKEELCHSYSNYVVCMQSGYEEFMETSPLCIKKPKKDVQRPSK